MMRGDRVAMYAIDENENESGKVAMHSHCGGDVFCWTPEIPLTGWGYLLSDGLKTEKNVSPASVILTRELVIVSLGCSHLAGIKTSWEMVEEEEENEKEEEEGHVAQPTTKKKDCGGGDGVIYPFRRSPNLSL
uniref:Uncharacterized protein n=1 Tax=Loa loa TaxID=7209 RepID=A0A1I7VB86_LOALO